MNVSTRSSKFLSRVTIQHSAYIRICIQNSEINHLQLLTFIDYTKLRVKTGIGKEFIGSNNSVSLTFQSLTFYVSDCTFNSSRWAYIYKFKLEVQRTIQNNWRIFASRLKLYVGCILAEENFLNMDMYFFFIVHEVLVNE